MDKIISFSSAGPYLIGPERSAEGAILATALGVLRTALLSKQLHEVVVESFRGGYHPQRRMPVLLCHVFREF